MGELREVEAMIGDQCSHGVKWACQCRECDLISARELVRRWKPVVEEAELLIEALELEGEKG
jgi:hypothetical protein